MKNNFTGIQIIMLQLLLILPLIGISQSNKLAMLSPKNYSIIPKFPKAPKPEPFVVTTISIPQDVEEAVLANYLPDGEHLILDVTMKGKHKSDLAVMKEDGTGFKCLTCNLEQKIGDEMPVPLPDGKRVYTPNGVLECSPSIVDCKVAKILPLVFPTIPNAKFIARIATNMSQDGIHVAYTLVTTRMLPLVLVSELTRVSDEKGERYELTKTRVIAGEKMYESDSSFLRPHYFGNGEVKSFTDMGRYLSTITTFEANNYDICKIDLMTGALIRFTRHFSYDEGVYPSPDGKWIIFQSQRNTNRMDAFGLIPRPIIAGTAIGSGIAEYRNQWVVPNRNGEGKVRRFYGLTMVDQYGDRARLPEEGYTGQNLLVAKDNLTEYNAFGNLTWHPSSTKAIFWEQKDHWKLKEGEQSGRLRLIRFTNRNPTKPLPIYTPKFEWATKLEELKPISFKLPTEGILKGKVSGYAKVSIDSTDKNEQLFRLDYNNFTDDGDYILNGFEKKTNKLFTRESHWFADIIVSGKHIGFLRVNDAKFYPGHIGSGIIDVKLDNHTIKVDLSKGLPTGVIGELR